MAEISQELIKKINGRATVCDLRLAITDEMDRQEYNILNASQT